jgi:hypothetical protein
MSLDAWRRYWQRLDWVQELSHIALLAMEACIIYPWQRLVYSSWLGHDPIPLWALALLLWVSYWVAGILKRSMLTADRRQAVIAGLLILSVLAYIRLFVYPDYAPWQFGWVGDMANGLFSFEQFPPELVTILVVFVGWWRGIVAARGEIDTPTTWFHFRVGVVLMFVYLLVTIFGGRADATLLLVGFFFCGLISIALARILELGGIHASTLGSRRWLIVLIGATIASLGVALLVTILFSRQTLGTVLSWFRPLWRVLGWVAWMLIASAFYLAFPLIEWALGWLSELRGQGREAGEGFFGSMISRPFDFAEPEQAPAFYPVCRTIIVLVIIAGGVLLVARLIRKLMTEQAERRELERESILTTQEVVQDLRASLRERLNQLRNLAGQLGGGHRRSIASIRKIYASMVDLATEAGYPRRAAETPYEYRRTLYAAYPSSEGAIDTITEAYVRTHYGEVPDTPEKMAQIVDHWQQLQERIVRRAKEA